MLMCSNNNLTSLSLSGLELLQTLVCANNELASLNLSQNIRLGYLSCGGNFLTHLKLDNNTLLENTFINQQRSTRRFQIMSNNSNVNDCWALQVGTTDASRIRDLHIDGVSQSVTMIPNNSDGWMIVSNDLKRIPKRVIYEFDTGNSVAGWMRVVVDYHQCNYGVYINGKELTSLNFYDIPGLKSGTAYVTDETSGIKWSGYLPTLVLSDAMIEGEKGIVNEECYNFKIVARGNNVVKATNYNAFESSNAVRTTISGDTLQLIATGGTWNGVYKNDSYMTIADGTTLICKGEGHGFMDDGGALDINESSTLMAYGSDYPSVELPFPNDLHLGSDVQLRYPEGAYIGNNFHVYYEGTTTDVKQDWVVMGPSWAKIPPYLLPQAYDLWVGGVRVTYANKNKINGNENLKYDPATNTLSILKGMYITGQGSANDGTTGFGAGIYSEIDGLTIDLGEEGTASVQGAEECYGIYLRGKTTIKGNGMIYSKGYYGIYLGTSSAGTADLTVDGKVHLVGESDSGYGISGYIRGFAGNLNYYCTLTIKGDAVVEAKGVNKSLCNLKDLILEDNHAIVSPAVAVWNTDKHAVCDPDGNYISNKWVVIKKYISYDLNNDGKVSTADIQVIINEMKKPQASQNMDYDLNGDGKISTADIQVIINEMKK